MPYPTETIEIFLPFARLEHFYGSDLAQLTLKATWQTIEALAESLCNATEVDLSGFSEIMQFPYLAGILADLETAYDKQNLLRMIADCL
jgi:predicted component of type VI protein secretion system